MNLFKDCKGYASRANAVKALSQAVAGWPEDERGYVAANSMVVILESGRYLPAVRFRTGLVNSLLFGPQSIGLF